MFRREMPTVTFQPLKGGRYVCRKNGVRLRIVKKDRIPAIRADILGGGNGGVSGTMTRSTPKERHSSSYRHKHT